MNRLSIPSEQRKSAWAYLIMVAAVMVCLLCFRSPEKMLSINISRENSADAAATVVTYTPKLSLPKGVYRFELYGTSGTAEVTVLSSDGVVYGQNHVDPYGSSVPVELDRDVSNLLIRTESESAESAPSYSLVRVISDAPIYTDGVLLALLVLTGLLALGYIRYLRPQGDQTGAILFVVVTGAAIIASYPLFTNYLYYGHDLNFHLWRIEGIKDGLLSGQFPVRVHPTHNNGYGYITASVYPELFLYLPAVLRLLGVSSVTAYKMFLFAMNLATAWIMYRATERMSRSRPAAGMASVIYTLSTWRLINAYHRAAIGEVMSMTFFPLAVLGAYYILKGDKSRWYVLAIACTCIFQVHVISTVLIAILLVVLFLAFIKDLFRDGRFLALCKAGVLTVLLNLWYLIPFAYYYFSLDMVIHHTPANTEFFSNAIIPAELFNVFNDVFGYSQLLPVGVRGDMSLSLGVGVSLCLVVGLLYYLFRREKVPLGKFGFVVFFSGVALTFMASSLFPWEVLQQGKLINQFAGTVRMPWRFLSLASPLLCMVSSAIIVRCVGQKGQKSAFAAVCVLCALTFVTFGAAFTTGWDAHVRKGMAIPEGGAVGWDNEYFLITTDRNGFIPDRYLTSDPAVQVTGYEKRGSNIDLTVSGAVDGAYVEVPLLYYPGYGAKDDRNQELTVLSGNNDVLRVMIRQDTTKIRIRYQGLPLFKAATLVSALTLLLFIAYLGKKRGWKDRLRVVFRRKAFRNAVAISGGFLILALFLEIFVFNFYSVASSFYDEQDVLSRLVVAGGLQEREDGAYLGTGADAVLELQNLGMPVKNLHLRLETGTKRAIDVVISATDAANSQLLSVPSRTMWAGEPRMEYLPLHFSGDVQTLRIRFNVNANETVRVLGCEINAKRPIFFSFGRFLLVWLLSAALFMLRPKSFLHQYRVDLRRRWQRVALAALVALQIFAFWHLVQLNPAFTNPAWAHHAQYHRLTEAFLSGHTYLNEEPPQALIDMENPYDYVARSRTMSEAGQSYLWDHAYYNGRYYVYFGVVPVLLFYLPYYLVMGSHMPTYAALFITSAALVFGVLYLLYQIVQRWFRNAPFTLYVILAVLFINSCGIIYILKRPDFYSLPILMAIVFAVWGVGLWIAALGKAGANGSQLNIQKLALGSACVALIAGCRPHLLITMGLGVILFWRSVFYERTLFSKRSVKATLALCAPFAIVAAGIMAYNFARFGSIFDFGANYNLTFNDMRQRGFVWARSFLGIFSYLFQPSKIEATFPFIKMITVQTSYLGNTITEGMFGGVIYNNPVLWLSVFALAYRKQIAPGPARAIALIAPVFALLLAVLDTQMAGILPRYQSDFTWLLLLSSSIGALALYGSWRNAQARHFILGALMGCLILCLAYHGMEIVVDISDTVQANNPQAYYHMQSLVAFWM